MFQTAAIVNVNNENFGDNVLCVTSTNMFIIIFTKV